MSLSNTLMSNFTFTNYINALKKEYEYHEKLYSVGMFEMLSQMHTFDMCVKLLEIIFDDTEHKLSEWIFEENFGELDNTSTSDIYKELIDKEGDDISQNEEC